MNKTSKPNNLSGHRYARRREYLETHLRAINELESAQVSSLDDLELIVEAAASIQDISSHIIALEEMAEADQELQIEKAYPKNEFRRIKELATNTASQLEKVADQISWGRSSDRQFAQVKRNLYPLKQLVNQTLVWLNGMVR